MLNNADFLTQFNVLLKSYLESEHELADSQELLRSVMTRMSYGLIGPRLAEVASSGGYTGPRPHLASEAVYEPLFLLAGIYLSLGTRSAA